MVTRNKLKVLFVGESSHLGTGFGSYTKNLLHGLYNTNKYDIAELSCFRNYTQRKTEPWKIYPVSVPDYDKSYKEYISNPLNKFGLWRFDIALAHFKPDVVIDIRDYWNFGYQSYSCFRPFFKWIIAPTYDSTPPTNEAILIYKNANILLTHSYWAKMELEKYGFSVENVVHDAVDSGIFKINNSDKNKQKLSLNIPKETFVIGTVMRNQKRKLFSELFDVFSNVIKSTDKKTILYLHTYASEPGGWDIESLLLQYGLSHRVYFTYMCSKCQVIYASKYHGITSICKNCGQNSNMCSTQHPLSDNQLNDIYNVFDLYIQYSNSEGLGIPQLEAASCGIPVITIDSDVMKEIGDSLEAKTINIVKKYRDIETHSFRSYPNNEECTNAIIHYIDMDKKIYNENCSNIRKKLIENYSWNKTIKKFESILDNINISDNMSWSLPARHVNNEWNINTKTDIRDTIYNIVISIIDQPELIETYFIQNLINRILDGFVLYKNERIQYDIDSAISELKTYANNKYALEKFRTGISKPSENLNHFLNY